MIRFGSMSFILLFGAVQGGIVATGLLLRKSNRESNALLAVLVLLFTLKLVPYIIGYAGFYMAFPWLDLAPFDLGLGFGPILYLYVSRLTSSRMPVGWRLHLIPVLLQLLTYLVLFAQPLAYKNWFEDHIGKTFNRIEGVLVVISLCSYLVLTWACYREYDKWLRNQFGDPDRHRLRHLYGVLLLFSLTLVAFVGATLWGLLIHALSYFQMFPFYVLLTAVVYAFGFVAFQFAELTLPRASEAPVVRETNWPEVAAGYSHQMKQMTFWSDPQLSISMAAKALGTSEARLSKAINVGLGITFSEWINRYRIEKVAQCLIDPAERRTILELSFECGFNSKASFNRWWRAIRGGTPTEFREAFRREQLRVEALHPVRQQSP